MSMPPPVVGVVTTATRQQYLPPLLEVLAPVADTLTLFVDQDRSTRDNWPNMIRAIRTTLRAARKGQPALVCTDDMIAPPDWYDRWQKIHAEAGGDIYGFFSRQRYVFTEENMARGWARRSWGLYDAAMLFIDHPDFMDRILAWFNEEGRRTVPKKKQKHLDSVMDYYIASVEEQEVIVTVPTLFDHVGFDSSLGHSIGQSHAYVGDGGALRFER